MTTQVQKPSVSTNTNAVEEEQITQEIAAETTRKVAQEKTAMNKENKDWH